MLHSGSRGIGNSVGTHFINKAKEEMGDRLGALPNKDCAYLTNNQKTFKDYCRAVSICQQYAQLNREMIPHSSFFAETAPFLVMMRSLA